MEEEVKTALQIRLCKPPLNILHNWSICPLLSFEGEKQLLNEFVNTMKSRGVAQWNAT